MKTSERAKYIYLTLQLLPTEKEREALQTTWNNYKEACNGAQYNVGAGISEVPGHDGR